MCCLNVIVTGSPDTGPVHAAFENATCSGSESVYAPLARYAGWGATVSAASPAVLVTVANNEGLSQTGLVDRTGIDRSTLADIVRRMQKKGLLQRRRTKEDARAYAVKLTDEGRRVLRTAEPLAKRVDERILEALPAKQRDQFIEDLLAIADALQKISAPAGQR